MKIKRVTPLSLAKIIGAIHALVAFAFGVLLLLASVLLSGGDGPRMFVFGLGAPIVLPLFYGIMGFLMGYVTAWLYNIVARYVGGIEIETE